MAMETKIVGPGGVGTTIWWDVKLNIGDKTNGKYHGGIDGYEVYEIDLDLTGETFKKTIYVK